MKRIARGIIGVALAAGVLVPLGTAAPASAATASAQGAYSPIAPARVLDTRPGAAALTTPGTQVTADAPLTLQVAGRSDLTQVPPTASAVVMNVTVTNPSLPGYLAVAPHGSTAAVSNLNFAQGETIPNLVTVQVGSGGSVDFTIGGWPGVSTDVVADVQGYYLGGSLAPSGQSAGTFVPVTPVRLYDTRATSGPNAATEGNPVAAGTPLTLGIAGRAGVPSDAAAAVLNVTVTNPSGPGFAAVRPGNASGIPSVSNLNFTPGETIPNLVTVPLSGGQIQYFSNVDTNVVVDLAGYYVGGSPSVVGAFQSLTPTRILDTRDGSNVPTVSGNTINYLQVEGAAGVPASGVGAVVMNTTVTNPVDAGFLSVFSGDLMSPPTASNLNYVRGQTIPNLTIPQVGSDGTVGFYSYADTDIIADVTGYFLG